MALSIPVNVTYSVSGYSIKTWPTQLTERPKHYICSILGGRGRLSPVVKEDLQSSYTSSNSPFASAVRHRGQGAWTAESGWTEAKWLAFCTDIFPHNKREVGSCRQSIKVPGQTPGEEGQGGVVRHVSAASNVPASRRLVLTSCCLRSSATCIHIMILRSQLRIQHPRHTNIRLGVHCQLAGAHS